MHTETTYEKVNSGTWAVTHPADFRHGRGGRLLTLNNNLPHTPQNAQQATYALPELPTWRPRDGRNDHHIKWLDALTSMEADLDIVIDCEEPTGVTQTAKCTLDRRALRSRGRSVSQ